MAGEWHTATLGDVVSLQRGHDLSEDQRSAGSIPVMGSFGVTGYHNEARARGPGVTIGRSGASFGATSYVEVDYWPLNTCMYVTDFRGNNPKFCYFLLKTIDFAGYNSGSAQPSLNRNFIYPIELRLPPRGDQDRIANLLGSLDDKIELNRRMAATLEEMARALFKSWFVDFDPVRAKAEGRNPGLPATTAALFPDAFGGDGLPVGWNSVTLGDLATLDRSTVDPSSLSDAVVDHYSLPAFDDNRAPVQEPASSIKSLKLSLSAPVVLFSKLNPDTPRVWPLRRAGKIAVASTEFLALRPSRLSSLTWLTCLLSSDVFVAKAAGMVTGTSKSHQRVQPDSLLRTPWPAPADVVMAAFEQVVAPLHERVDVLLESARQLAALRDTLLPKLISGELRIKDMGKDVEAA